MKIVSKYKLLCESDDNSFYCKGNKLFLKKKDLKEYISLGHLPISKKYRIIQNIRILQRLFRLEPRCAIFTDGNEIIVSMHGNIYRISANTRVIVKEHSFRKGMNNPLSFCKITNLPGFDDGILYGEYFGNEDREEVNIFLRNIQGIWKKVYSFKPGTIQHIHRIFVHRQRKSIFVLTGDRDSESAVWEFKDNFSYSRKIVGGKQKYRACVAFPCFNGIVYATDTPLQNNGIYKVIICENDTKIIKICDINGPCIYGSLIGEKNMAFATSVEPDSRLTRIHYMISYKLGRGVKNRYSHIYYGNPDIGFRNIFSAKKDFWPMLLFGFGTFQFPEGIHNDIILTGQSVRKYDGKTIKL